MASKQDLVAFRLTPALVARVDAIASALSRPGLEVSRSEAAKTVLVAGLALVEEREGIGTPAPCTGGQES
jgi:hypothetical protein